FSPPAWLKRPRLRRRQQFSLLIVRADGSKVFRCNVPHRAAVATASALALGVLGLSGLVGDYVRGREMVRTAAAAHQELAEHKAVIESFNKRVAGLHHEVSGWRDFHARIWAPFGPDAAPKRPETGIGGGDASPTGEAALASTSPLAELDRLAETVAVEGASLKALDRLMSRAGKILVTLPSRWPLRGAVNSEYGKRLDPWTKTTEFHAGMDIDADVGTPVRAPANGTVVVAGRSRAYGNTVVIDHGQDIRTLYAHLAKVSVSAGQKVERGSLIAFAGNTGRSSGPHLHYEILVKGRHVNPRAYLWD
ncbi:MAG: M23 family metallopeptidase, partial [Candidatus Rokuibacteriota bacterium]